MLFTVICEELVAVEDLVDDFLVDAKVNEVVHEKYPGDVVERETITLKYLYTDTSNSNCIHPGPEPTPLLKKSWCGFLYLNIEDKEKHVDFYASESKELWIPASGDGNSFSQAPSAMCEDPSDYATDINQFETRGESGAPTLVNTPP